MADLVTHPLHAHLSALFARIRACQGRLNGKQVRPAGAISNGTAWVSPTATIWKAGFARQATTYVAAVHALDDGVADLLRRTPATCTAEEAAKWRVKLAGHHGA